jgi:transposase
MRFTISDKEAVMGDLFLLREREMARISPFFPASHGVPRVDSRPVVSGIIYVIRNGLQWKDAPTGYGPHKTLYNRSIRWSLMGVFDRIFAGLGRRRAGRSVALNTPTLPNASRVRLKGRIKLHERHSRR